MIINNLNETRNRNFIKPAKSEFNTTFIKLSNLASDYELILTHHFG